MRIKTPMQKEIQGFAARLLVSVMLLALTAGPTLAADDAHGAPGSEGMALFFLLLGLAAVAVVGGALMVRDNAEAQQTESD